MNSEDLTLKKTPFSYEKNTYKAMPGFNLSYTNPVSENFGHVLTAASNTQYNPQSFFTTTWNTTGTGTAATPATPNLQTDQIVDAPKCYYRHSVGVTADWRITRNSVLSAGMKASYYRDDSGNLNWSVNAGTVAASTIAGGTGMTYGPTFTSGATGRGTVTMGGGLHHITQVLLAPNLRHRFDNGLWRIESGINYSKSKNHHRHLKYGHFNSLAVGLREPARVVFNDIAPNGPASIDVYNNANQLIDLSNIDNYALNTAATAAQLAANYVSQVTTSLYIEEEVSAYYAQTEMRFLKNRLHFLTGVRYEKVTTDGAGPLIDNAAVWVRNPDGSFAHNAAGRGFAKPKPAPPIPSSNGC